MDGGHIDLVRARKGGFAGGFFAVWTPNKQRIAPDSMPDTSKPYTPPAVDFEFARSVALRMTADLFRLEAESEGAGQGRAQRRGIAEPASTTMSSPPSSILKERKPSTKT